MRLPNLKSRKVNRDSLHILPDLFRNLAIDLHLWDDIKVQRAESLLRNGKYISFLEETGFWSTQQYASHEEHLRWNQLSCLLKKYPFTDPKIDREGTAMKKFFKAEHVCKRVNQRFAARKRVRNRPLPYSQILESARRHIESLIGFEPDMNSILDKCDFGPGASVGVHGSSTHSAAKLMSRWSVTPAALPVAISALWRNFQIQEHLLGGSPVCLDFDIFYDAVIKKVDFTCSNKIICVPKTAMTDRTIAIEPLLNGFVQKGIDIELRHRLRRWGIDLSDQTRNQRLAKAGSLESFNPFVTIDLSSASDTISKGIVQELLPTPWYSLLCRLRSTDYEYKGRIFSYEKFSSMGNGFSFPLETLIFASLVRACYEVTGDREFAVYGDDIIVRQGSALLLIEVLRYCGFSTNVDKTFLFGPFRESCGADYFRGEPVRPYYIDEPIRNWPDLYKWLNGIQTKFGYIKTWYHLYEMIPMSWRFTRPFSGDDTSITVELDEHMCSPYSSYDKNIQNWRYARATTVAVNDSFKTDVSTGILMYGLLRGSVSDNGKPQFALRRMTRTRLSFST